MYTPCDLLKALINGCRGWGALLEAIITTKLSVRLVTFDLEQ